MTGKDLDALSAEELSQRIEEVSVFARASPEHKFTLVEALQQRGQLVAVTGDGVNDAPALKKADIGVAMGETGTDVAREASEMVLQDDNFSTIVAAVEEGRIIFENIRKLIKYLLASNSGELWVMLLGPLAGMPLPLVPLQILWMNLITDGPPALALVTEPGEPGAMNRPPHPRNESVFARRVGRDIVWIGLLMGLVSLGIGFLYWRSDDPVWQTMVFTTLTFSEMFLALSVRSQRESVFNIGFFSNRLLLGAVALSMVLQLAVIYVPFLQPVFETKSLAITELAMCAALGTVSFWALETVKWFDRRRDA